MDNNLVLRIPVRAHSDQIHVLTTISSRKSPFTLVPAPQKHKITNLRIHFA